MLPRKVAFPLILINSQSLHAALQEQSIAQKQHQAQASAGQEDPDPPCYTGPRKSAGLGGADGLAGLRLRCSCLVRGGTGRTSSAASASAATATVSGVGDDKAVVVPVLFDGCAVAADRVLGDRVNDRLSIGLDLQSAKASGPAVVLAQGQRSSGVLTVRNQADGKCNEDCEGSGLV